MTTTKITKVQQFNEKLSSIDYQINQIYQQRDANFKLYTDLRDHKIKRQAVFSFGVFLLLLAFSYPYLTNITSAIGFFGYCFFSLFFAFSLSYIYYNVLLWLNANYALKKIKHYNFDQKVNDLSEERKQVYNNYIKTLFNEN